MPWARIGNCGHSTTAEDTFEFELGIEYLKLVCGKVPKGCELGVMRQEFDGMNVGEIIDLPSGIGLLWDDQKRTAAPWDYISQCEVALGIFHEAVDWSAINPEAVMKQIDESEETPEEF